MSRTLSASSVCARAMAEPGRPRPPLLSIAAVERETGLSKDTLRVWERRYGFPAPQRDAFDERAYPLEQVERLRLIKRLLDAGHRPGRIVAQPLDALQRLGGPQAPDERRDAPEQAGLRPCLDRLRAHDVPGLRRELAQVRMRLGLERWLGELITPLDTLVGEARMRGELQVFEERLCTESLRAALRRAIDGVPWPEAPGRPMVLLSAMPNEPRGIGLLVAEALLLLDGCRCASLGEQTPIWDTALAAGALGADIVLIACGKALAPAALGEGLVALREALPGSVELWVGGHAPLVRRRPAPGVTALASLAQLASETARWRIERA